MSKLEDLHTLVRLLNEFELPVSPILEYAIKEKEKELISSPQQERKSDSQKSSTKNVKLKVTSELVINDVKITKKNPSVLRVIRTDGTIIEEDKAATTLCKVIKEVGADKVYEMKIPMDGMHLVTKGGNPQYPTAQHDVGNDLFINVHSNTLTKKRQLEKIFKALNLNWVVDIVESN